MTDPTTHPYTFPEGWLGAAEGHPCALPGCGKGDRHPIHTHDDLQTERNTMTFQARFKVQDVGEGPAPINVLAVAEVEDGSLYQNTEKARSMELRIVIDADETSIAVGDTITASGHFTA